MKLRCFHLTLVTVFLVGVPAGAQPESAEDSSQDAAKLFAEGQELYKQGKYLEAIKSFSKADALAPHPSAQFNIARCYENVGQPARALKFYKKALASTQDETTAADIRQRVERLQSLPVKIFVATKPSGATVTVGGQPEAQAGATPLVVRLRPGSHVLLLRKAGYHLAAHRVVVEIGKQQAVEVALKLLPRSTPCPKPSCPKPKPLFDPHELHLHAGLVAAIGWTLDRPLLPAPGVRGYASYRRFVLGTHVLYAPVGEEPTNVKFVNEEYNFVKYRSILVQVEGGWIIPFDPTAHLSLTGGLGVLIDQVVFSNAKEDELVREKTAFAWSIGASLESMVNRWISVGVGARFGVAHGDRVPKDDPGGTDENHHFPFLTFWGTLALHL